MINTIFVKQSIKTQHQRAPLLSEREEYLRFLLALGRSRDSLQNAATMLLHMIRLMEFTSLRNVNETEIREAGRRWALEQEPHRMCRGSRSSAGRFIYAARDWLRFQHLLAAPPHTERWFDAPLNEFIEAIKLRLSPATAENYARRTRKFLMWLPARRSDLSSTTFQDIDDFVEERRTCGTRPSTVTAECQALRRFFDHARTHGWCEANFIHSIRNPALQTYEFKLKGPSWKDVRKLIKSCDEPTVADHRARAIILLCAIYALRNSEVIRLTLEDFDWQNETFIVRRAKRGRTQQFPIQYEVGQAIIQYLQYGRPSCLCRNLFVTQHTPYRPLKTLWPVISRRFRKIAIESENCGSHSLRHACATELLRRGTPLRDIADFLGHRDVRSVSIYARHDLRSLREVAKLSLAGIL
jgi:site-specific recombinase XerD